MANRLALGRCTAKPKIGLHSDMHTHGILSAGVQVYMGFWALLPVIRSRAKAVAGGYSPKADEIFMFHVLFFYGFVVSV